MNVLKLRCNPIPNVRIGFIGLGNRGYATLQRYMVIEGITVTALCDLNESYINRAQQVLEQHGRNKAKAYSTMHGWAKLCQANDIDLIYICTDWQSHTQIAVEAMRCGKHVAIEVPAAMTVNDCWTLVETAENTRCHCVMLENCCYDPFALTTLHIARLGLLGDITHCEGAYIHDLRSMFNADEAHGGYHKRWMSRYTEQHMGNPYPTHGLGPICQLLNIHRGDRMTHLVSLSTSIKYEQRGHDIAENHINNTLIRTKLGRTILIQYDVTTPRPYSRLQVVCGTRGYMQKYPLMTLCLEGQDLQVSGTDVEPYLHSYAHPATSAIQAAGYSLGVPNIMNYTMDYRLINALRNGEPLDMDVYDAAEWSCITELSQLSASKNGQPVEIPDFTRGHCTDIDTFNFT